MIVVTAGRRRTLASRCRRSRTPRAPRSPPATSTTTRRIQHLASTRHLTPVRNLVSVSEPNFESVGQGGRGERDRYIDAVAEMHDTTEEYLETILELEEEGVRPLRARLVERLGVSAPAVSETVNRLIKAGYAELREDRSIKLTTKGRGLATTVVRRHRLAERLLADVIGLEWEKVHREAARWEHAISADVEEKLVELLGDPMTCPHGNPIPGTKRTADAGRRSCGCSTPIPAASRSPASARSSSSTTRACSLVAGPAHPGLDRDDGRAARRRRARARPPPASTPIPTEVAEQMFVSV